MYTLHVIMGPNSRKIIVQFTRATEYKHKLHLEKEVKKKTWVVTFLTYTLTNKSEFASIQNHISSLTSQKLLESFHGKVA